ncbi:unnamed protein product [Agarophyton chilense]
MPRFTPKTTSKPNAKPATKPTADATTDLAATAAPPSLTTAPNSTAPSSKTPKKTTPTFKSPKAFSEHSNGVQRLVSHTPYEPYQVLRPISPESTPTFNTNIKPSNSVKDKVREIDERISKENAAPQPDIPPTRPEQAVETDTSPNVTLQWTPRMGTNVLVTGSFCDWKQHHPLCTTDGSYALALPLPPGKHLYKFIVDGKWFYDVTKPIETDSEGNVNNVMYV